MGTLLEGIASITLDLLGDALLSKGEPMQDKTHTRLRAWATRTFGDDVVREMERPRMLALPRGQR